MIFSDHRILKMGCAFCNWTGTVELRGDALRISYPCECRKVPDVDKALNSIFAAKSPQSKEIK